MQHYLQQRDGSGEAARLAGELKLRAERKLGMLLKGQVEHGGDRKSKSDDMTLKTIPDGISRDRSSRWQTIAVETRTVSPKPLVVSRGVFLLAVPVL